MKRYIDKSIINISNKHFLFYIICVILAPSSVENTSEAYAAGRITLTPHTDWENTMKLDKIIAVRTGKTVYRDGENCVKVFNADHTKADIIREAFNQALLEEIGIGVPKIKAVTVTDGKWAIVSEFISGKTLARLMEEEPEKKDEYLNIFVDIHLYIHSKECTHLAKLKDKTVSALSACKVDASVKSTLLGTLGDIPEKDNLCHGDFNPSNIIVSDGGVPYILDWSCATQGDPDADAARTYLLFLLDGDDESADKYLELYCKKSNTSEQRIKKWIPITAASNSVTANEKERKFLMQWVDEQI